jgi:Leucine-rich repeat (LRR) protein
LQKALPKCEVVTNHWQSSAFARWADATRLLPAEQQIEAVRKKLIEINPGFDGQLMGDGEQGSPQVSGGAVRKLSVSSSKIVDISPVRVFEKLNFFSCSGSSSEKGMVADVSPLEGMNLLQLNLRNTHVADLSPLRGMQLDSLDCSNSPIESLSPLKGATLTRLNCAATRVSDLAPLRGISLESLDCSDTPISDLSVLVGMPLIRLKVAGTGVSDLSPLSGIPLEEFDCHRTRVPNLSPLRGRTLVRLDIRDTPVTDLSPLEGMNLVELQFTPAKITNGIDLIRKMASLQTLSANNAGGVTAISYPAIEFWKRYDAGEFGRPLANSSTPFMNSPAPPVDPDRAFAEWALMNKAEVAVVRKNDASSREITARGAGELPSEPFWVVTLRVNPAVTHAEQRMQFTDDSVERLIGLSRLRRVEYYDAVLTDAGMTRLATLPTLETVIARDMDLNDAGCLPLFELPHLKTLALSNTRITDRMLQAAAQKPTLKNLDVTVCGQLTDAGLAALVTKGDWEKLGIGSPRPRAVRFTDAGLLKLTMLEKLTQLDIQGLGKRSTYEALRRALPHCSIRWRFPELRARLNEIPMGTGYIRVVARATGKELKISREYPGPPGLVDADIDRIIEINIPDNKNFRGELVGWLLSELTDVEILNLEGTGVKDPELPWIAAMTGLKQVSLCRTEVTAGGIAKLRQSLPNCKIEWDEPSGATSR